MSTGEAFREVMAGVATPVSVLTAFRDGAPHGRTGFDGVEWVGDSGTPRLTGSPGWLACTVARLEDGGDHVVVLGDVVRAASSAAPPLVHHARTFGTHRAAQEIP